MNDTTTKHTPGPWEATEFTAADGKPFDSVGELIAHTALSARHGGTRLYGVTMKNDPVNPPRVVCYSGNGKASEANARLIAAAPDMLEHLKRLDKFWSADNFFSPESQKSKRFLLPETIELWNSVRAAIKAAEGE